MENKVHELTGRSRLPVEDHEVIDGEPGESIKLWIELKNMFQDLVVASCEPSTIV